VVGVVVGWTTTTTPLLGCNNHKIMG
jgi:hypothetical protein